jgi:hypothetical protein
MVRMLVGEALEALRSERGKVGKVDVAVTVRLNRFQKSTLIALLNEAACRMTVDINFRALGEGSGSSDFEVSVYGTAQRVRHLLKLMRRSLANPAAATS